jgi:hypothetical protein
MATGSGAFGVKGGFNQSGGGHFIVLVNAADGQLFENPVTSGSGGAYTAAVPVALANGVAVTIAPQYAIIRDMGRTVAIPTTAGGMRTFRKFQVVGNSAGDAANFGVVAATTGRSFFLETMREGQEPAAGVTSLRIARYM